MRKRPIIVTGLVALLAGACSGDGDESQPALVTSPSTGATDGNRPFLARSDGAAASGNAGKADVCHREGNGSFHLINISARAVAAHVKHGDGLPGELVPGDPSKKFDGTCALVDAAVCPCRFTLGALQDLNAQFGDLGSDYELVNTNIVTQVITRSNVADRRVNRFVIFQAPGPAWPQSFACVTRVYEPAFAILHNEELRVTFQEAAACVQDLTTLATVLGVPIP